MDIKESFFQRKAKFKLQTRKSFIDFSSKKYFKSTGRNLSKHGYVYKIMPDDVVVETEEWLCWDK